MEQYYFTEAGFKPGARELLEKLKAAGVPVTIATSTDKYCILAAFDRLGYTDYFDAILTCGEVGASKSEPKIFYEAARIMGTEPSETWLFEDGLYSIKTAKAAGFKTVGIYDSVSEKDQAEIRAMADIYLESLNDFTFSKPAALSIAGSDCSGGAGIQADLKTMMACGVYAMSAVTALTAQNTTGVTDIMEVTPAFLAAQLDAVFTDIRPEAGEDRHGFIRGADRDYRRKAPVLRRGEYRSRPGYGGYQRSKADLGRRGIGALQSASPFGLFDHA